MRGIVQSHVKLNGFSNLNLRTFAARFTRFTWFTQFCMSYFFFKIFWFFRRTRQDDAEARMLQLL